MSEPVVVIDSSDEEEPPPKVRKLKSKLRNGLLKIQIADIKSLVAEDVVVIEDEEECVEIKEKDPLDEVKNEHQNGHANNKEPSLLINGSPKKQEFRQKRIKFVTIKNNISNIENVNSCNIQSNNNLFGTSEDLLVASTSIADDNIGNNKTETKVQENSQTQEDTHKNGVLNGNCNEAIQNSIIPEFETFLETCRNSECGQKYKTLILQKIPDLQLKYDQAEEKFIRSKSFKELLEFSIRRIKSKPLDTIIHFNDLYRELSVQRKRTLELSEKEARFVIKLNLVLARIKKKIVQLENAECNWDEEGNSEYIMLDRYKKRGVLIHKKICAMVGDNPYASRQIHKSLNSNFSKYPLINRAVDKFYSKKKQFPSIYDIDKCIRKCVKDNNIVISDAELEIEIREVFKQVGALLARRRKQETYEILEGSVTCNEPEDPKLSALLDERHLENEKKINKIIDSFVDYQENGVDPAVSSDSDDSTEESEDSVHCVS